MEHLYSLKDELCLRCGYKRQYLECDCGDNIGLEEQDYGGLCGYHYHQLHRDS